MTVTLAWMRCPDAARLVAQKEVVARVFSEADG